VDDVDQENGLKEEQMIESLAYLVLGKFERREGDDLGRHAMLWLSLADLDDSALSEAAVDAAITAWETQEARLRAAARPRARAAT